MTGPDNEPRYLFDDEALERALAGGTEVQHQAVQSCADEILWLPRVSKESFLEAFPNDKERAEKFQIIRKKVQDNHIAAAFADQLQNYGDIDSDDVQDKIILLATAYRAGVTVVTGEYVSPTTRIKILAEQVNVRCINVDEFFDEIGG